MAQPIAQPYPLDLSALQERRHLIYLVILFMVMVVIPFLKLPLLGGRSLSLPIMALIVFEVLTRYERPAKSSLQPWTLLIMLFNAGLLLSFWVNMFKVDLPITLAQGFQTFFGYWYWSLTTMVIIRLIVQFGYLRILVITIGIAAIALAAIRLFDVYYSGGWGAPGSGADIGFSSKNFYGLQFSTFALFTLLLPILFTGTKRLAALAGLGLVIIAVLGTGSRGSWAGLTGGLTVFMILYAISSYERRGWIWFAVAAAVWFVLGNPLPQNVDQVVNRQTGTFAAIEEDENYAFRLVMNQKSQKLIKDYPLFGVGLGQYKNTYVPDLVIPGALQGTTAASFIEGSAHNSYLFLFAETGLIGMLPFALFLGMMTFQGGRIAFKLVRQGDLWSVPVYASFISMSIHLWVISGLASTGPWVLYGLLTGVILAHRDLLEQPCPMHSLRVNS